MITEKAKAGALTPAKKNELQEKSYPKADSLSNLKNQIGQSLLSLTAGISNGQGWQQFEGLLRQFYEGAKL